MTTSSQETVRPDAVRRCLSVLADVERELAELVKPADGGTALLTPSLPLVWDANQLRLLPRSGIGAEELVRTSSRLAAEHNVAVVTVSTDDPARARVLGPSFAAHGWGAEQHVVMVATGAADRAPHRWAPVAEVSAAEVTASRRDWLEGEPWSSPPVVEQILERDRRLGAHLGERCLAVHVERRVVSYCRLYQRADVAQIEDVYTAPQHRNKGYARAVVAAARATAEAAAARDIFLVADAEGWPRRLYERLGFTPARILHRFRPETA